MDKRHEPADKRPPPGDRPAAGTRPGGPPARLPRAPGRVVVIGAGVGGLAAAALLAARGAEVIVLEQAGAVGGKIRTLSPGPAAIDAGPTVLTMRGLFEALFAAAGDRLDRHLTLRPAAILARHAWSATERLDLHADPLASEAAIGAFAGPDEARAYRRFRLRARATFETLERAYLRAQPSSPLSLLRHAGPGALLGIDPFSTLWQALGREFRDPRLRQLFGRYATYCGGSPFEAPATLALVAHVEASGVWLVQGGMIALAEALARLARGNGALIRTGQPVAAIIVAAGRARGVLTRTGERIAADAVLCNADVAALALGLFGAEASRAVPGAAHAPRSLSAQTWAFEARTSGFPLERHNVFFSADYAGEFADIAAGRLPSAPSVYLCAQDRGATPAHPGADVARTDRPERLFCIVNAPPLGDRGRPDPAEEQECLTRTMAQMRRCGLEIETQAMAQVGPREFAQAFPGSGGALYGRSPHGWRASFSRPLARSRLPGLFLAGGSVHPGPGVPMAALSGWMAAEAILAGWTRSRSISRPPSRQAATAGGMSTRSAPTDAPASP